jgi:predicted phosphoribosyltransferase
VSGRGERFRDRVDAGQLLADQLDGTFATLPVVLGLPRGGVVVAAEVAKKLRAPLDVILVRKLGVPFQPELAMGAIGEDEVRILDSDLISAAGLSDRDVEKVEAMERANLERAGGVFRRGRRPIDLTDKAVVIVDDGIATGATVRAACEVARLRNAASITIAAPVASVTACDRIRPFADRMVILSVSDRFLAISQYYDSFDAVPNVDVVALLDQATTGSPPPDETI